jgi:hypothetical protein
MNNSQTSLIPSFHVMQQVIKINLPPLPLHLQWSEIIMSPRIKKIILAILLLYVVSYGAMYSLRPKGGSANLAYFAYTGPSFSDTAEHCVYYFYFPIYKIHRLLGGQCHTYDRGAPVDIKEDDPKGSG